MTLEHQVCSLELTKKLKALGVKQESYFSYCDGRLGHRHYNVWPVGYKPEIFAAFTVAELGEMLPMGSQFTKVEDWACRLEYREDEWIHGDTEADARAKLLIYLLENGMME